MASLPTRPRPRSRVTGQLLLLTNPRESSSNDVRFQAILHNTIALDHFRQFCFQEYSLENLLFWMDVELFASPSQELLELDKRHNERTDRLTSEEDEGNREEEEESKEESDDESEEATANAADADARKGSSKKMSTTKHPTLAQHEHFSVQHARYIYLTYIDACAPLQVNLNDEIRSEIPWPILDESHGGADPAVDRHIFDAAQEHTYQLMRGHTLARFEESDLWKAVETMIQEKPEEYTRANIDGTFNSHYRPSTSVIRDLVRRSKSRSPTVLPHALYNWNNSTSDLDRARDKEETLAEVMRQYFGPIPAALRHQTKLLRGLGLLSRAEEEEYELGLERAVASSGASGDGEGIGSGSGGDSLLPPPRMHLPRSNSSNTFLSIYSATGNNNSHGGHQSNRNSVISSTVDLATTKRFSTASAIATRWMVAGYFDDEIRLTSAQRRKLLHRNNKLTRFFGSRVDGTLLPVHEGSSDQQHPGGASSTQKHQGSEHSEASSGRRSGGHRSTASSASMGSSIALPPGAASSSLSNSNMRSDQGILRDDAKKLGRTEKRVSISGPTATTLSGGSSRRGSKSMVIRLPSQRERFFARFRPRSTYVDSTSTTTSTTTIPGSSIAAEHPRFSFVVKARQQAGSGTGKRASTSSFSSRKEGFLNRNSTPKTKPSHKRVMTLPQPLPHPLWMGPLDRRGSLSDQEGISPSDTITGVLRHERLRAAPSIHVASGNTVAAAGGAASSAGDTAVVAPETGATSSVSARSTTRPRHDSTLSNMQGAAAAAAAASTEQDHHQTLRSRRKKADKLASFFGTPLTPWELSTQLKMEQEADSLVSDSAVHQQQQSSKGSSESARSHHHQQHQQPVQFNPTYASINQLSERDRTILWKRSKKLKELLGQTLPEMDVEAALTLPVLRRRGSSRSVGPLPSSHHHYLHVASGSSFRRRRPGSRVAIRSRRSSLANSHPHGAGLTRRRQSTVSTSGMRPVSVASLESSEWLLQGHHNDGSSNKSTPSSPRRSVRSAATSSVTAQIQYGRYLAPTGQRRPSNSVPSAVADKEAEQFGESRGVSSALEMDSRSGEEACEEEADDDDDDDLYEEVTTTDDDDDSDDDDGVYEDMGYSATANATTTNTANINTTAGAATATTAAGLTQDGQNQQHPEGCASSRLGQKKRMDKIQQFMGERVPKQDLWVGAVGRESARKMLESMMAEDHLYLDEWEDASPPPPAAATDGRRQTLSGATSPIARLRPRKGGLMSKRRNKKAAAAAAAALAAAHLREKTTEEEGSEEVRSSLSVADGDGLTETDPASARSSMSASVLGGGGGGAGAGAAVGAGLSSSPLSGLLHAHHRSSGVGGVGGGKKKVRTERSLSDPPALPSSFAPRAFVKGVFRSGKDSHGTHHQTQGHGADGAAASPPSGASSSSSPKNSTASPSSPSAGMYGRSSADAILSKTTYHTAAPAAGGHGELKCLDEETLQSMPRLRTMAAGDKERFMKRAEKLNRLFGAIPPSALLESSLTTFPLTRGFRTEDDDDEQRGAEGDEKMKEGRNMESTLEKSTGYSGELHLPGVPRLTLTTTTASLTTDDDEAGSKRSGRHTKGNGRGSISSFASLYELAGRLASHSGGSSPPASPSHRKVDLKDDTAKVVESLAI
ncbi:hypothetical protein DFQ27_005019 [Actinomortierella ambigua]|uniref:RGS domain-containing protein n=1 Tax=Actinomortierella ambigua TaxID=1343610 RepID=A0A9P6Q3D7_9FUNG|nr:hypothetical protein DFQ27_005019 [Actinomortierella ambigua]